MSTASSSGKPANPDTNAKRAYAITIPTGPPWFTDAQTLTFALVALNQGAPAKARDLLQTAVSYELGQSRSAINCYFGALYPVYVSGQVYLATRQGAQAAGEFQRILDHRGITFSDPISVLAHLQLGRAYVMSGETAKARSAYVDFLTLWQYADPSIPILKQARAEYARLK